MISLIKIAIENDIYDIPSQVLGTSNSRTQKNINVAFSMSCAVII